MKIHRYIYTRLSKDASPTGKSGFQSAFLPGDLLSSKEVLEIESHIHFPEGQHLWTQSVVLYKQLKGELYMILLLLRPLPDVKDEHGRGGTFLCEGFMVAEKDWRPINLVSELAELVEPRRFAGLDALLASPDVDRQRGKISDLDLPFVPGQGRRLDEEEDEPAADLLMAIYHVAHTQNRDLSVVLQGAPSDVTTKFEICSTFMPDALRPLVAWNDAFDGGKIFFSPLRIFGYAEVLPVTGRPALFTDGGKQVTWPDDEIKKYGQPDDPFAHWLLEVCVNPVPRKLLNEMYALSNAMVSKSPKAADMPTDQLFELVNRDAIRTLFESGLHQQLGERWAKLLSEVLPTAEQLQCWMRGYPVVEITRALEAAILTKNLSPEVVKEAPAAKIVAQGSASLQLLATMWTLEVPGDDVLAKIGPDAAQAVLGLMLGRGTHVDLPFMKALGSLRSCLPSMQKSSKLLENLQYYMDSKVPKAYEEFKAGMVGVAMDLGDFSCLADDATDWLSYLNRWLVITGGDSKTWKALKKMAKSEEIKGYPNVLAFAEGATLPRELERKGDGRKGYLRALISVHGVKDAKLLDMGFFAAEIKEAGGTGGIFGKIKRLFGRGR